MKMHAANFSKATNNLVISSIDQIHTENPTHLSMQGESSGLLGEGGQSAPVPVINSQGKYSI